LLLGGPGCGFDEPPADVVVVAGAASSLGVTGRNAWVTTAVTFGAGPGAGAGAGAGAGLAGFGTGFFAGCGCEWERARCTGATWGFGRVWATGLRACSTAASLVAGGCFTTWRTTTLGLTLGFGFGFGSAMWTGATATVAGIAGGRA
jgi:hypothetical protein